MTLAQDAWLNRSVRVEGNPPHAAHGSGSAWGPGSSPAPGRLPRPPRCCPGSGPGSRGPCRGPVPTLPEAASEPRLLPRGRAPLGAGTAGRGPARPLAAAAALTAAGQTAPGAFRSRARHKGTLTQMFHLNIFQPVGWTPKAASSLDRETRGKPTL